MELGLRKCSRFTVAGVKIKAGDCSSLRKSSCDSSTLCRKQAAVLSREVPATPSFPRLHSVTRAAGPSLSSWPFTGVCSPLRASGHGDFPLGHSAAPQPRGSPWVFLPPSSLLKLPLPAWPSSSLLSPSYTRAAPPGPCFHSVHVPLTCTS